MWGHMGNRYRGRWGCSWHVASPGYYWGADRPRFASQELAYLEDYARQLEDELSRVKSRIEDLKRKEGR